MNCARLLRIEKTTNRNGFCSPKNKEILCCCRFTPGTFTQLAFLAKEGLHILTLLLLESVGGSLRGGEAQANSGRKAQTVLWDLSVS